MIELWYIHSQIVIMRRNTYIDITYRNNFVEHRIDCIFSHFGFPFPAS